MKKILVVDDDILIIEVVKAALKSEKYELYTACNVDDAIKLVDANDFSFLITDIVMPGKNGDELIKYVRKKGLDIPILAITGGIENALEDYVDFADLFADYTLAKPFGREDLVIAMEQLFSRERLSAY